MLDDSSCTYQLVLTKADALSRAALAESIEQVQRRVGAQPQHCGCFPAIHVVSAAKDFGLRELRASFAASLQLIDPE